MRSIIPNLFNNMSHIALAYDSAALLGAESYSATRLPWENNAGV